MPGSLYRCCTVIISYFTWLSTNTPLLNSHNFNFKMFKYRYGIEHDSFYYFGNGVTKKKVQAVGNKSGKHYRQSAKKNFDNWVMKKDKKVDTDSDSSFGSVHKSFLNLQKGKKRVIRCSNCLELNHNKQTCETDPVSSDIKKDFKLTKAKKRKNSLAFKIQRRKISKDWYLKNRETQRQKIKIKMRIRRKKRRQAQLKNDLSMF